MAISGDLAGAAIVGAGIAVRLHLVAAEYDLARAHGQIEGSLGISEASQIMKTVRVASTIEYLLKN